MKMIKLIDMHGFTWWINPLQIRTIIYYDRETHTGSQISMGGSAIEDPYKLLDFHESPEEILLEIETQQLPKYKQEAMSIGPAYAGKGVSGLA